MFKKYKERIFIVQTEKESHTINDFLDAHDSEILLTSKGSKTGMIHYIVKYRV